MKFSITARAAGLEIVPVKVDLRAHKLEDGTDYYAINPAYGTADDLKRLVREAHARGLKVIIDIVANHTSWDSVLMKHPEFYKRDSNGNITYPYDWYDIAALNALITEHTSGEERRTAFAAQHVQAFQVRDGLRHGGGADPQAPRQVGGGQRAGVGRDEAREDAGGHAGQPRVHHQLREPVDEAADRLGVTSVSRVLGGRVLAPGRGGAPGTAGGGVVGVVGPVPAGAAVASHFPADGRRRPAETPGDLRVPEPVGEPGGDAQPVLVGEPASRHRRALPSAAMASGR